MHVSEREELILSMLAVKGFVSFRDLQSQLKESPATIRRDLERMALEGQLVRVRGGVKSTGSNQGAPSSEVFRLAGATFHENMARNTLEKEAIGKEAAARCSNGEAIMIDGGSTTLHMCPHLAGRNLSILSNSLHIVSALINQPDTRVLVPGGAVFPEQSIILPVFGEDTMPKFYAPKLFMGAAAIGPAGLMQVDPVLVASERRLIDRAEKIIVLADASKFNAPSGNVVCGLEEIDTVITDQRISEESANMLQNHGINLVIVN